MPRSLARPSAHFHLQRLKNLQRLQRRHALQMLMTGDDYIDWSPWYLTDEEDMGQSPQQGEIIKVLISSLEMLADERRWPRVLIGFDHFFAWVEHQPKVQVSPDVFILDDPPGQKLPRRWETWRPGQNPPRFAVEIVSSQWQKDYEINPSRYDHLGVSELVIADPDAWLADLPGRVPLVVYRRGETELERVYRGRGPAYSAEIDAHLIFAQPAPGQAVVRISRDPEGRDIVPTAREKTHIQAAELEALRARVREFQKG